MACAQPIAPFRDRISMAGIYVALVVRSLTRVFSVLLVSMTSGHVLAATPADVQGPPAPPRVADALGPDMDGEQSAGPVAIWPGSEELSAAIDLAVRTYPTVAAARASERGAIAGLRGARWQRFPSVNVELLGTASGAGGNDFAVTVEEPLWTGGRISGVIKMSRAQVSAASSAVQETQLDVSLRVSAAYFDFQRLIQRETILEDSLREHQKLVDSMVRRVAVELSPLSDLDLARSRTAQVAQELAVTAGQRQMALTRLRELTGDPSLRIASVLRYDPALHHPGDDAILDDVLAFDPKRKRLKAEILIADADVQVRRSALFPQLNAQYQKPVYGPDRVGVVLRAQTDGGLSRFSAVTVAQERRATAEIAILANERELREVVEADLLENSVARERASTSSLSATSAQAVTDSFMRQFVAGRRTWFDVMNAVRESMTARLGEVDARVSAMASATRLLMRSGRWTIQADQEAGE